MSSLAAVGKSFAEFRSHFALSGEGKYIDHIQPWKQHLNVDNFIPAQRFGTFRDTDEAVGTGHRL
jgi:hypothetical protein